MLRGRYPDCGPPPVGSYIHSGCHCCAGEKTWSKLTDQMVPLCTRAGACLADCHPPGATVGRHSVFELAASSAGAATVAAIRRSSCHWRPTGRIRGAHTCIRFLRPLYHRQGRRAVAAQVRHRQPGLIKDVNWFGDLAPGAVLHHIVHFLFLSKTKMGDGGEQHLTAVLALLV